MWLYKAFTDSAWQIIGLYELNGTLYNAVSVLGSGEFTLGSYSPPITVRANSLSFGKIGLGASDTLRLTLRFANTTRIHIDSVNQSSPKEFTAYTVSLPEWFNSSDSLEVSVVCRPDYTGRLDDTIRVFSNLSANSFDIHLQAQGSPLGAVKAAGTNLPKSFSLYQNFPNPFNPSTKIYFGIPNRSRIRVSIYDVLGRRVGIVADQDLEAGYYFVTWDARQFSSGVYFCRLETLDPVSQAVTFSSARKIALVK